MEGKNEKKENEEIKEVNKDGTNKRTDKRREEGTKK